MAHLPEPEPEPGEEREVEESKAEKRPTSNGYGKAGIPPPNTDACRPLIYPVAFCDMKRKAPSKGYSTAATSGAKMRRGKGESITVPGGVRHKNEIMGRLLQASDLMEASTAHGQHDV